MGTTYYFYMVEQDLELTVSFANYVEKNNSAFAAKAQVPAALQNSSSSMSGPTDGTVQPPNGSSQLSISMGSLYSPSNDEGEGPAVAASPNALRHSENKNRGDSVRGSGSGVEMQSTKKKEGEGRKGIVSTSSADSKHDEDTTQQQV